MGIVSSVVMLIFFQRHLSITDNSMEAILYVGTTVYSIYNTDTRQTDYQIKFRKNYLFLFLLFPEEFESRVRSEW